MSRSSSSRLGSACGQALLVALLIAGLRAQGAPASGDAWLAWQTGISSAPADHQRAFLGLMNLAVQPGRRHVFVQFDRPVGRDRLEVLRLAGVQLLVPLGRHAYFAAIDAVRLDPEALLAVEELVRAEEILPEWKLSEQLRDVIMPLPGTAPASMPSYARVGEALGGNPDLVALYTTFHADTSRNARLDAIASVDGVVISELPTVNSMVVQMPLSRAVDLLARDDVQYMEAPLPAFRGGLNIARCASKADSLYQTVPPGGSAYGLDGGGVTVMVYDTAPADATHPTFNGDLENCDAGSNAYVNYPFQLPKDGNPTSWDPDDPSHATVSAGIIGGIGAGSGVSGGDGAGGVYHGLAPQAYLKSYAYESPSYPVDNSPTTWVALYHDPGDLLWDCMHGLNTKNVDILSSSVWSAPTSIDCNKPIGFPPPPPANQQACKLFGAYGIASAVIDGIVRGDAGRPLPTVWISGNDRGNLNFPPPGCVSYCSGWNDASDAGHVPAVGPPGNAKNPTVVGSTLHTTCNAAVKLSIFSNTGPSNDGRFKPDLVAPGENMTVPIYHGFAPTGTTYLPTGSTATTAYYAKNISGTSNSGPVVAGIEALILQYHRQLAQADKETDPSIFWDNQFRLTHPFYAPMSETLLNSTVKALLIHNATDIASSVNAPGSVAGPDSSTGWGLVNAEKTIQFMNPFEPAVKGFYYEGLLDHESTTAIHRIKVHAEAGDIITVTLAWDDPPASPNVLDTLVNDLDLVLVSPNGLNEYIPTFGSHTQNNVEQVRRAVGSVVGDWQIEVRGSPDPLFGQQWFSACVSFNGNAPVMHDCNGNNTADQAEASSTGFPLVPNICESDCNGNGVPDLKDLADGIVSDVDQDGIPDTCESPTQPSVFQQIDCAAAMPVCNGTYSVNTLLGQPATTLGGVPTGNVDRVWFRYQPSVIATDGNIVLSLVHDPADPGDWLPGKYAVEFYGPGTGTDPCATGATLIGSVVADGSSPDIPIQLTVSTADFALGTTYAIAVAAQGNGSQFLLTVNGPMCHALPCQGYPCQPEFGFGSFAASCTNPTGPRLSVCGPALTSASVTDLLNFHGGLPAAPIVLWAGPKFVVGSPWPGGGFLIVGGTPTLSFALPTDAGGVLNMNVPGINGLGYSVGTYVQAVYKDVNPNPAPPPPYTWRVSNAVLIVFHPEP